MGRPPPQILGGPSPLGLRPCTDFSPAPAADLTPAQSVADPGGGKSGHGPHGSCQWSLAPLGGRKSNDSIVNLSKSKDFGSSRIDVGYGFGPPTE